MTDLHQEVVDHICKICDPHLKEIDNFYKDLKNRIVETISKFKLEEEVSLLHKYEITTKSDGTMWISWTPTEPVKIICMEVSIEKDKD